MITFRRPSSSFKSGDVVVVRHQQLGNIIKRVQQVDVCRKLKLAGDNALSTSSDTIGWQENSTVLGRVIWKSA